MTSAQNRGPLWRMGGAPQPVSPLELLFDLVFVYALSQFSQHLHHHLDWAGALQTSVLILVVISLWFNTIWVVNLLDVTRTPVRAMVLVIMFVGALVITSIAGAFADRAWLFVSAYVAFQIGRSSFMLAIGPDPAMRRNFVRTLIWLVPTSGMWLAGAADENPGSRLTIWGTAVAVEYVAIWWGHPVPGMGRTDTAEYGLAGSHIVERCRLLFLIAVGETVISGLMAFTAEPVSLWRVVALGVAFTGTVAIWWIYFHRSESVGMSLVEEAADEAALGKRAIYTLVVMIAGLVAVAVGDELVIAEPTVRCDAALSIVLYSGPALYLAGKAWFFRRVDETSTVAPARVAGIAALAILGFLTYPLPALLAAVGAALVLVAVAIVETRAPAT
ncbi:MULTISPECIES: low temperature requirement protein A [Rhodococcus]|uniref:Low temperature requirement protein A n=1 Tax=Rhodococcus oxybenzonivorans TaxID=1990687 RepID=A0AAE4UVZ2_9NOCA|nr:MULTISPECIES: low temperature requirement protein A [Rhodococcus]MDV7243344.1 low temperature requirement protein A [Rhodococcus oxybenzonivorans]MDV7263955.1 low temperature requirement protein A [Rhodococcus oxybenzonivorans]MDV7276772.1 low temperature requirement protein A [Rhodococcus oxybenzonivorans]MDV7334397.1 low temperature requirement protein A [Rhodococcus oxybenzonivorans]MDV7344552.1 low temperature requirement protein A [Rhodococcus oxybenzonivorans]